LGTNRMIANAIFYGPLLNPEVGRWLDWMLNYDSQMIFVCKAREESAQPTIHHH
jgi:hypothetical protein